MRVLVLAFDPITDEMPGPAIRAWNLAEQLAGEHAVRLATTSAATRTHRAMDVIAVSGPDLASLAAWADVVVAPTSVVRRHPAVAEAGKPLCIDMYIPTHLENLEPFGEAGGPDHQAAVAHQVAVINDDLRRGDYFLCASERQRDLWIGALAVLGRINPRTYDDDPSLRRLIDMVPFGIPGEPPRRVGPGLSEAFPGIDPSDPVVIWGGGIYNWLDPLSLLRAVDRLRTAIPAVRLVFLGMRNPNPDIPEMRVAAELRRLSDELSLTGSHVFFNDGWVPYDARATFLLDACVGVSTHLEHVETRFSFRTRVLDYLWAGLPMVLTEGDTLSEEIDAAGLGVAVPPGDPDAVAAALRRLIEDPPDRERVQAYAVRYRWEAVTAPLRAYCSEAWRAPDVAGPRPTVPPSPPRRTVRLRRAVGRALRGR